MTLEDLLAEVDEHVIDRENQHCITCGFRHPRNSQFEELNVPEFDVTMGICDNCGHSHQIIMRDGERILDPNHWAH